MASTTTLLGLLLLLIAVPLKLYFNELPGGLKELRAVAPVPVNPLLDFDHSGPVPAANNLANGNLILVNKIQGLETVEPHPTDPDVLFGPDKFGKLVRIHLPTETVTVVADLGGRGLGLKFAPNGDLYVANEVTGLQVVNIETGSVQVAANTAGGKPISFCDDIDIDSKGIVYFSDASGLPYNGEPAEVRSLYEIISGVPTGRLIKYNPETKETEVLIDNLLFANGVALAANEEFVLVAETATSRIHRYWLAGEKAGTADVFADGLPGLPDGVSRGAEGRIWVALFDRIPLLEALQQYPTIKRILLQLPLASSPQPKHGLAFCLSQTGKLIRVLEDRNGDVVHGSTAVTEHNGKLFFGNLNQHHTPVFDL